MNTAPRPAGAQFFGVCTLVAVVVGIIAVAFRGSWGALRDAALAAHFDRDSASLYPFAVDGLLVVAIIAAVLLRHDRGARWYCLGILAGYTGASWFINFLHGLGTFTPDPVTGIRPGAPWYVVVVVASLVIGSIFLGSHLLVFVWRHLFPGIIDDAVIPETGQDGSERDGDVPDDPEPPAPPRDNFAAAKAAFLHSLQPGLKRLSQRDIVEQFGVSKRDAARVQREVEDELGEQFAASRGPDPDDETPPHGMNGRVPALERGES